MGQFFLVDSNILGIEREKEIDPTVHSACHKSPEMHVHVIVCLFVCLLVYLFDL